MQTLGLSVGISLVSSMMPPSASATIEASCPEVSSAAISCFFSIKPITTTVENPDRVFTYTPTLPEDPENWKLDYLYAYLGGVATYSVTYQRLGPDDRPIANASLAEFSILDASGEQIVASSRVLDSFCFGDDDVWKCADGNGMLSPYFSVPPGATQQEKDAVVHYLAGPLTVKVDWVVSYEGTPDSSVLAIGFDSRSVGEFGYRLRRVSTAVPEPTAAALYAAGIVVFAAARRRIV